jgi:hypothetical protein
LDTPGVVVDDSNEVFQHCAEEKNELDTLLLDIKT